MLLSRRVTETGARSAPASNTFALEPPAIALPKGGGAIRGIGEKFGANPVMGTGSTSIPIFTTPGRSGFRPALALTYDSGAGNGPFGFGWQLAIPAITRKTDKGIPRYHDDDVFLLAGVEDLVPELRDGAIGETTRGGYRVRRYRPRIEGLFARIERWTSAGDTFWRSISRDNVTTIYGNAAASRIADGDRTFSWLPCESFDDKGNAILYEYASEDFAGVDRGRGVNRYLKRIHYGNRTPTTTPSVLPRTAWMFEVVLDYGEGHCEALTPSSVRASSAASRAWSVRPDAFSSYRAGFEIRTYRR